MSKQSNSGGNSRGNGKKRKVYSRMVNVSAGGGPPQSMTPEAAAQYLQQATAAAAAVSAAAEAPNKNNREVKISFGPSRPPTASGSSTVSLDLRALKETAVAAAAAHRPKGSSKMPAADGLPCSEEEMKALMSMFVEIMGMTMETDKRKGQSRGSANGPVLSFGTPQSSNNMQLPPGWPDKETLAAATAEFLSDGASWDSIRQKYGVKPQFFEDDDYDDDEDDDEKQRMDNDDDDDDDDDSMPSLVDMRDMIFNESNDATAPPNEPPTVVSATDDATPEEGDSFGHIALEGARDALDRARKATKKREKKQRRKQRQRDDSAQKAAEAAKKKREKAILSWRSRVISACHSTELPKLEALLQESPLRKPTTTATEPDDPVPWTRSSILPHLEFLLPNAVAKNRSHLKRGIDTRHRLATYIFSVDLPLAFVPLRTGRSSFHTACFLGDLNFVELVLELMQDQDKTELDPQVCLDSTCDDSGWAPLHYAALSGSMPVLEALLRAGCSVKTITNDMHTWRNRDGIGVSPLELAQSVQKGKHEDDLESHGVALQEMQHAFFGSQTDKRTYLRTVAESVKRLVDVETNGYPSLSSSQTDAIPNSTDEQPKATTTESASARKRKKKKKKKQAKKEAAETTKTNSSTASLASSAQSSTAPEEQATPELDPLVSALMGMGFTEKQISAAVTACGGTNRATADDLVTWILGQEVDGPGEMNETTENEQSSRKETLGSTESPKPSDVAELKRAQEDERQKEEAAKRLAAKREEQRRRNREWNNARQQEQAKARIAHVAQPAARPPPTAAIGQNTVNAPSLASQPGSSDGKQTLVNIDKKDEFPTPQEATPAAARAPAPTAVTQNTKVPTSKTKPKPPKKPLQQTPTLLTKPTPPPTTQKAPPAAPPGVSTAPAYQPGPTNVLGAPPGTRVPPAAAGALSNTFNSFPPIGDDDRTVSSLGSNRAMSVSSVPYGGVPPASAMPATTIPPPGFMASNPNPFAPQVGDPSLAPLVDSRPPAYGAKANNVGEIRATAKAFIPQGFSPSPEDSQDAPTNELPPPLSESFTASPLDGPIPEMSAPFGSLDHPAALNPSFLSTGLPPPSTGSSLLGSTLPTTYDQIPSVATLSGDSAAPTTGPSLAGLPNLEDPSSMGLFLGLGADSSATNADNASSLVDAAFGAAPPAGGASIWGASAIPQPSIPSLSGIAQTSFGDSSNGKPGEGASNGEGHQAGQEWGTTAGTQGSLSIW